MHGEEGGKAFLLTDTMEYGGTVDASATGAAPQWLMRICEEISESVCTP